MGQCEHVEPSTSFIMPKPVTTREFENAFSTLRAPRGKQPLFLLAHLNAKGRALNMRRIAQAAGYKSYRGGNLQYGLLAERIGKALGRKDGIALLVEFVPPKRKSRDNISNDEWILVMRPGFAAALRRTKWGLPSTT